MIKEVENEDEDEDDSKIIQYAIDPKQTQSSKGSFNFLYNLDNFAFNKNKVIGQLNKVSI